MDQSVFVQTVVNGIMLGLLIILFALGLSLVFGIMRIVNFAHGELYMLGGFAMWFLRAEHDWPVFSNFAVALIISMLIVAFFGIILEKFIFRKWRGNLLPSMLVSVGLTFLIQGSVANGWGYLDKALPSPTAFEGTVSALGATLSNERLFIIAISIALVVALYLFLTRTNWGGAMRATSQHAEAAVVLGIATNRASSIAMAIGCALAAAGGALAGTIFLVNPYIGSFPLLKAFVAIVLGGMGSLPGTVLGGFVIGMTESFGVTYVNSSIANIFVFAVLIAVLVVRPAGLLGREFT